MSGTRTAAVTAFASAVALVLVVVLQIGSLTPNHASSRLTVAIAAITLGGGRQVDEREHMTIATVKNRVSKDLACTRATFFASERRKGGIEFSLHCDGAGVGNTNRVVVARFNSSRPGAPSDFQAVLSSSAQVESPHGSARGRCRLRRGVAWCIAPLAKALELKRELRVPPDSECARAISAYVVLPPSCDGPACNLEFATESLFRGRPAGCAS